MAGERAKHKFQKRLRQSLLLNESFAIVYRCQKVGEKDCFLH